jgi:hypothetical protein
MEAAVSNTIAVDRYARAERAPEEVRLPKPPVTPSISPQAKEDAVITALKAEPKLESPDDALSLARSLANRIGRDGGEALQAQANLETGSIRTILE